MIEEIENESLAHDILYGSSPRDMVNRAIDNILWKNALNSAMSVKDSEQIVYDNLDRWLRIDQNQNYYSLGTYVSYVSILKFLSKSKAEEFFNFMNPKLSKDSFLFQINSYIQSL